MRPEKPSRSSVAVIIICAVLILGACAGFLCYKFLGPVSSFVDIRSYLGLSDAEQYAVCVNEQESSLKAVKRDGMLYLPLETAQSIDRKFFYDSSLGEMLYALPTQLIRIKPGEKSYSVDDTVLESYYAPFITIGEDKYIASAFVKELAGCSIEVYDDTFTSKIWSSATKINVKMLRVKYDTQLRAGASIRNSIVCRLAQGDALCLISEEDGWLRVMSERGLIGYVRTGDVVEAADFSYKNSPKYDYSSIAMEEPVVLVWHQMNTTDHEAQVSYLSSHLYQEVNVVSPTFYSLAGEDGSFRSISSALYVDAAHIRGLKVWAMVDNFNNGKYDNLVFLSNYESRQRFINGIVDDAVSLGVDGLNIDFEADSGGGGVGKSCAGAYLEFIRELSIRCRLAGLVLSVDNYVPASFNLYFDRAGQAEVADYIIMMGYDEHYAGSDAGPVASKAFVEKGITDTLSEVPKEKLINAIPFYTRLWKVDSAGNVISSEAKNMTAMNDILNAAGAKPSWSEEIGNYYAEFTYEGENYKVWTESAESVRWRVDMIKAYGLAGVACWKMGLETEDIWNELHFDR